MVQVVWTLLLGLLSDDKNIFFELAPGGEGLLAKGEKASFSWKKDGESFDPEERFKVTPLIYILCLLLGTWITLHKTVVFDIRYISKYSQKHVKRNTLDSRVHFKS